MKIRLALGIKGEDERGWALKANGLMGRLPSATGESKAHDQKRERIPW